MSINFEPVASDVAAQMSETVNYILGLNISPADKIARLSTAFNLVGSDFYVQMFGASSEVFDSTALKTADFNKMTDQIDRLSTKLVRNNALGYEINPIVKDFYNSALGKAMSEAFTNAVSMDKHPTVTRTINSETCNWCIALAGTYVDPDREVFARHRDCDCFITVSGYKSRNGILNNYTKGSKNTNQELHAVIDRLRGKTLSDIKRSDVQVLSKYFKENFMKEFKNNNDLKAQIGDFIQNITGYSSNHPIKITNREFEMFVGKDAMDGSNKIFRGFTNKKYVSDFENGKIKNKQSAYGYGSYFTTSENWAEKYTKSANGVVVEAKITEDARILEIGNEYSKLKAIRDELSRRTGYFDKATGKNIVEINLVNDIGSMAALCGYDAVDMSNGLQKIMLILNRDKLVIKND